MKKLLFVDHAAHKLTRSSNFFIEILSTRFDVTVFYLEPELSYPENLIETAKTYDIVVVWQMDYLASIFTILGIPTVIIPMYDGSELMPDLHWIFGRHASYLNFSLSLHHRVRMTGGQSKPLRYFRPPVAPQNRADLSGPLKAFLWLRRPDHGITLGLVETLVGDKCERIHIHHAPDRVEDLGPQHVLPGRDDYELTITRWGEDPTAYRQALAECNIFIAPRLTEGIGMAFLEAMARGMVVIANDCPTHNEYVSNWLNGILFSGTTKNPLQFERAQIKEMADMAYLTVVAGYELWLESIPTVLDFIDNTPRPAGIEGFDIDRYSRSLFTAYYSGLDYYRQFLVSAAPLVLSGLKVPIEGVIAEDANLRPAPSTATDKDSASAPMLRNARMDLHSLPAHVLKGDVLVTERAAWVKGGSLELHMNFGVQRPLYRRANLHLTLPGDMREQTLVLSCNGEIAGIFQLAAGSTTIAVDLPASLADTSLSLRLQTTRLARETGINTAVSLGIERIEFE